MLNTGKKLFERQDALLAGYATKNSACHGRKYQEPEDPLRLPFQRDRDRIIHARAFRRLHGKTQVFRAYQGDHFRSRLTHTLEMTQIARDIARNLRLNEDLTEAIALAHDLGHTPFGHAGEEALNECMQKFGKTFEHNKQSRRVVEIIEKKYPSFPGLNLTIDVLDGLIKHRSIYDKGETGDSSLEAKVVNIADSIAYNAHDIDDGVRGKILTIEQCESLKIWKRLTIQKSEPKDPEFIIKQAIGSLIKTMVQDILKETDENIKKQRYEVSFSKDLGIEIDEMQKFLYRNFYFNENVLKKSKQGQSIIKKLFDKIMAKPEMLSREFRSRLDNEPKYMVVRDYIAGMTDKFAINLFKRIT
jgi:dGTPase